METVILILVLVFSVVIHEVAHGYAADAQGDSTARQAGRLTLNPFAHLSWVGSVLVPGILALSGTGFIFGWAKPVPFNPFLMKNRRWGGALVALAGPVSNILLAVVFAMVLRLGLVDAMISPWIFSVVVMNIVLALFNLIPVPPLDGHHILFAILGDKAVGLQRAMNEYALIIFFGVLLFAWEIIEPAVLFLTYLLVGV